MKKNNRIGKIPGIIGTAIFLIVIVFPFYWLIVTSVKDPADISLIPTELWPSRFSGDFYKNVFLEHHLMTYLGNSVIVAAGTMIVTILIAFPAAYAFSRINFKFNFQKIRLTI